MSRTTNWANGPFRILVPGITSPSDPSRNIGGAATRNMHAVAYVPMVFTEHVRTPKQNMNAAIEGDLEGFCTAEICLVPAAPGNTTSRQGDTYTFVIDGQTVIHTVPNGADDCEQALERLRTTLIDATTTADTPSAGWNNTEPFSVYLSPDYAINTEDCCITIRSDVPGTTGGTVDVTVTYTAGGGPGDGFDITIGGTPSAGNPVTVPLDCTNATTDPTGKIFIDPEATLGKMDWSQVSSAVLTLGPNKIELADLEEITALNLYPLLVANQIEEVRKAIIRAIRRVPGWTAMLDVDDDSIVVWTRQGYGPDSGTVDFDFSYSIYPDTAGNYPVFDATAPAPEVFGVRMVPDTGKFVEPQCLRIGPPIIT
jgi:hypothetical protein